MRLVSSSNQLMCRSVNYFPIFIKDAQWHNSPPQIRKFHPGPWGTQQPPTPPRIEGTVPLSADSEIRSRTFCGREVFKQRPHRPSAPEKRRKGCTTTPPSPSTKKVTELASLLYNNHAPRSKADKGEPPIERDWVEYKFGTAAMQNNGKRTTTKYTISPLTSEKSRPPTHRRPNRGDGEWVKLEIIPRAVVSTIQTLTFFIPLQRTGIFAMKTNPLSLSYRFGLWFQLTRTLRKTCKLCTCKGAHGPLFICIIKYAQSVNENKRPKRHLETAALKVAPFIKKVFSFCFAWPLLTRKHGLQVQRHIHLLDFL